MALTGHAVFTSCAEGTRVVLSGEIDYNVVDRVSDTTIAEHCVVGRAIYVDTSGVTFIDSTGLGLLLRLRDLSGGLIFDAEVPRAVLRVVRLAGLNDLLGL